VPNYEYRCTSCENVFEIWQEVGSSPPPCPECGSEVKKVFHPVRTIFKGSGFYVTDLRAEKGAASKTASTSETKSETKSETPASTPATTETAAPASTPAPAAAPAKTDGKAA